MEEGYVLFLFGTQCRSIWRKHLSNACRVYERCCFYPLFLGFGKYCGKLPFNVLMPRSPLFYYNNIVVDGCIFLFLSFQNVASKVCESYVCLTRNSTCDYYCFTKRNHCQTHHDNSNIYHLEKSRLVFQLPNFWRKTMQDLPILCTDWRRLN